MKNGLILVGGGGHCKACIDVIEQDGTYGIAGIIDVPEKLGTEVLGYEVVGTDNDLPRLVKEYDMLITIGQIRNPKNRIRLFENIKGLGGRLPVIVSPLAHVSKHARVGQGTIVMHKAMINAGAAIGDNCIINTMSLIEHDAIVGDHCHVASGALINGNCCLGNEVFVGSNAVLKNGISVPSETIISAGKFVR